MTTEILPLRTQNIELTSEERRQLNIVIDLLIPSDKDYPPPSSLHLLDIFLHHLQANRTSNLLLSSKRLRAVLHEMNILADSDFCSVSKDRQHTILHAIEQRNPALFQTILTFANHSYYSQLGLLRVERQHASLS